MTVKTNSGLSAKFNRLPQMIRDWLSEHKLNQTEELQIKSISVCPVHFSSSIPFTLNVTKMT